MNLYTTLGILHYSKGVIILAIKEFIAAMTLKAKIITVSAAVLITGGTAAAVGVALSQPEEYRIIKVFEMNGSAVVERDDSGSISAYEGMNLENGDVLTVDDESTLRIVMDNDKYVLLDGGTSLKLNATGSAENSKTRIELMSGEILNEITSSLSSDSIYEVATPKAVMAVRGTSFVVKVEDDGKGGYITHEQTLQGKVHIELLSPDGSKTGKSVLVDEDKNVTISTTPNAGSSNPAEVDGISVFVVENEDGGYSIVPDPEDAVTEINYENISDNVKKIAIYSDDSKLMVLDEEVARKIRNILTPEPEVTTTTTEATTSTPPVSTPAAPPVTTTPASMIAFETTDETTIITKTTTVADTTTTEITTTSEAVTTTEATTTAETTTATDATTTEVTTTAETTTSAETTTTPATTTTPVTYVPVTTVTTVPVTTPEATTTTAETTPETTTTTTTAETTITTTTTATTEEPIETNKVEFIYNNSTISNVDIEVGEMLYESDLPSISELGLDEGTTAFITWRADGNEITLPYLVESDITLIADPCSYINITFVGLDSEVLLETKGWSMHSVNDVGIVPPEITGVSEGCIGEWEYYNRIVTFDEDLSGDYIFYAKEYIVLTFANIDGNEISSHKLRKSSQSLSSIGMSTPEIPAIEGLVATEWIDSDGNVITDTTNFSKSVTATPDYGPETVTLTFVDIDGNEVDTLTFEKGLSASASNMTFPDIPPEENMISDYWIDENDNQVTADTVFDVSATIRPKYTEVLSIVFENEDGTVLQSFAVPSGKTIAYVDGVVPDIPEKANNLAKKWLGKDGMDYGTITESSVFTKSFVFVPTYTPVPQSTVTGQSSYTINFTLVTPGYTIASNGSTTYSESLFYNEEIGILTPNPTENTYFRYYVNDTEFVSTATVADIVTTFGSASFTDKIINITLKVDTL